MTPPQRPVFDTFALPLPPRRQGAAAVLSFVAHVSIAILVLWRGAALFEGGSGSGPGPRGGGGGGGRPAVSWFALPSVSVPQAQDLPAVPAVSVPTVAVPLTEPVKIDVLVPNVVIAPPVVTGTADGNSGGPGQGPGTGGGTGTGTGPGVGADSGSGSSGRGSGIIPPEPKWTIIPPQGMPRGPHQVRFWVTAEGAVTRVEVTPPIKDGEYRREFMKRMMGYVFRPARTRDGRAVDFVATVTFSQN